MGKVVRSRAFGLCLFGLVAAVAWGCGEDTPDPEPQPPACSEGTEGCPCTTPASGCDAGLVCLSKTCVKLGGGGSSGAGGSSGTAAGSSGRSAGGNGQGGSSNGGTHAEPAGAGGEPANGDSGSGGTDSGHGGTAGRGGTSGNSAGSGAGSTGEAGSSARSTGCADEGPPVNLGAFTGAGCMPPPAVIPGLSGPPVWLPPTSGSFRADLADPRWSGGAPHYLPYVTTFQIPGQASFRALSTRDSIYVAMYALEDNQLADSDDAMWFAFDIGDGGLSAYALAIHPDWSSSPVSVPSGVPHDTVAPVPNADTRITWYHASGSEDFPDWETHSLERPSWLHDVATWRDSPDVAWAITFRIDLAELNFAPNRIFAGARLGTSSGVLELANRTPLSGDDAIEYTGIPKDRRLWQTFLPPGSLCGGLSISCLDIGVDRDGDVGNLASYCGEEVCSPTTNKYSVKVSGLTPTYSYTNSVHMRVRFSDWKKTNDPNAPWKADPQSHAALIGDESYLAGAGYTWNYDEDAEQVELAYTCDVPGGAESCPVLSNLPKVPEQCMLVELAANPWTNDFNFGKAYEVRCLDFTTE